PFIDGHQPWWVVVGFSKSPYARASYEKSWETHHNPPQETNVDAWHSERSIFWPGPDHQRPDVHATSGQLTTDPATRRPRCSTPVTTRLHNPGRPRCSTGVTR